MNFNVKRTKVLPRELISNYRRQPTRRKNDLKTGPLLHDKQEVNPALREQN